MCRKSPEKQDHIQEPRNGVELSKQYLQNGQSSQRTKQRNGNDMWSTKYTKHITEKMYPRSHCCCLAAKSCMILCDHMDCRMPGFPVLHYTPDLAETHDH